VVVESPAKAATINKYLGDGFRVMASVGHVKDLPKSAFGVDVERDFIPHYKVIKGKERVVAEIRRAASGSHRVFLATDPDREGEAIAWHIASELGVPESELYRVTFNEITRSAVERAFHSPGRLDQHKVDAQQARRILDRIVGYRLSPVLWDKVKYGLSAGRVQTVAMRLICEREEEIRRFVRREYWSILAQLRQGEYPPFSAKLEKVAGKKAEIATGQEAEGLLARLRTAAFVVEKVAETTRQRQPSAPFITSQLQQEASRRLGFNPRRTMSVAQSLYEGVPVAGEGQVALITYMRTDSPRVSPEAQEEARRFIGDSFGPAYLPEKPPRYAARKGGRVQDAHECIRPTSVLLHPDRVAPSLDRDQARLYELIWRRFVASQMTPARYRELSAEIAAGDCLFRARGSTPVFDGFLRAYADPTGGEEREEANGAETAGDADEGSQSTLPPLASGDRPDLVRLDPRQHFTEPPPRYSEASLIRALEEKGIGRPSTYAAIITTIQSRDYTSRQKGRLFPTELGEVVTSLLVRHFPDIFDVAFTARMEDSLDQIEEGERGWVDTLREFYRPFETDLSTAVREMRNLKAAAEPTDIPCDACGRMMAVRWGKKGSFLSCSGYPECKNARNFTRDAEGRIVLEQTPADQTCEKCGKPMVVKQSRKGPFLACSGYPGCKNTRNLVQGEDGKVVAEAPQATDLACEKCGQPLVIRMSRRGPFLSCSGYPKCKNAKNFTRDGEGRIVVTERETPASNVACEKCGKPMVVKRSRRGPFLACSGYPKCKNARNLAPGEDAGPAAPPAEATDLSCEKCGKAMVVKHSRRGPFLSCSGYPGCKNAKNFTRDAQGRIEVATAEAPRAGGEPCEKCGKAMVVKHSRRGPFLACSGYPECRNAKPLKD
jgi:DNA topoisomerase-1